MFAITKICSVGKHVNIVMKPTRSPTQGQPNTRKIRLKVALRQLFSHSKRFFVSWDRFLYRNRLQETQTNQLLRKHPSSRRCGKGRQPTMLSILTAPTTALLLALPVPRSLARSTATSLSRSANPEPEVKTSGRSSVDFIPWALGEWGS